MTRRRGASSGRRPPGGWGLAACLLASACSAGAVGQSERAVNAAAKDAARFIDKSVAPMDPAAIGRVSVTDDAYLPADSKRAEHGMPLPAAAAHISVDETTAQTLPEIARTLSKRGGIPVAISPDLDTGSGIQVASAPTVSAQGVQAAIGRLGAADAGGAGNISNVEDGRIVPPAETATTMTLHWDGPYTALLDQISAKFGTTYQFNGSTILISRNITRTYTVHALASNLSLTNTLTGSGINGGSSGGSSNGATSNTAQTVSSSVAVKVWDDIVNGVTSIVGKTGSIASLLSTGTLTVTAPPPIIEAVQTYIDQQNRSLENEITITVQLLTVTLNNSDDNTFDLSAAIRTGTVTTTLGNQTPITAGAGTGAITPGVSIVSGGTTATLQAISKLGRVSNRTQSAVTTMNGFVAPFQLTNTRSYVASESVTNTGSSGGGAQTQTALNPGTVTTGFNIAVMPRVDFTDRTVLLQYGVSISALAGAVNGFDVFTTPDGLSSIQLANVNQQAFINNAEVPDGDTIVITGFNQDLDTTNKTGFGAPGFWGLSGTQFGSHSRQMTVIMITPTVLRVAHSPIQTTEN